MKKIKKIFGLLSFLLISLMFSTNSLAIDYVYNDTKKIDSSNLYNLELYVGGMPFGVKLQTEGLYVVKFVDDASPAKKAGIELGDIITKVNDENIKTIEEFSKAVEKEGNNLIKISVLRNNKELSFNVNPVYSPDEGNYKVGIWVKDSTSGIGTITFINPNDNTFGGLGHGICDGSTGNVIKMLRGAVFQATINGINKGKIGSAGELQGIFNTKKIGALTKNNENGVFGILTNALISPESKMKICKIKDVKEGDAYIWCTVDENGPAKYAVEISSIDYSNNNSKNFKVKIKDERLLNKTGGIVQGMSGSPIVQDGKLIGAVTHVLINNPTEGYGIFIENMIKAST